MLTCLRGGKEWRSGGDGLKDASISRDLEILAVEY